jgi:hypothetical protein
MAIIKTIEVEHNQSLFDIAIQEYGSVEAVEWLVEDNDWIYSVVDIIEAGDMLKIRNEVVHTPIRDELIHYELVSGGVETHPEGVGFWRIEKDFIVQ